MWMGLVLFDRVLLHPVLHVLWLVVSLLHVVLQLVLLRLVL